MTRNLRPSGINYTEIMRAQMIGLVRRVLSDVVSDGLPDGHHFYVHFDTVCQGVELPAHLRARYPQSMVVVLQHDFGDLVVNENEFLVTLHFDGKAQRLTIPFDSLISFSDPYAGIVITFTPRPEPTPNKSPVADQEVKTSPAPGEDEAPVPPTDNVVSLFPSKKK